MTKAFQSLREGDKLQLPHGSYVASGKMTLRTPDGSMWSEWLLVPTGSDPKHAIDNRVHRWLAFEAEEGLTMWSPADMPPGFGLSDVASTSYRHQGRNYVVRERDTMKVVSIQGNVGEDAKELEEFTFVDLSSGPWLMSVESNERGTDAYLGRRVPAHELVNWAKFAGWDLYARTGTAGLASIGGLGIAPSSIRAADRDDGDIRNWSVWQWLAFMGVIFLAIVLESCDDYDDCTLRINPQTGKTEYVCSDGVHSSTGRRFGGWGGK